MSDVYRPGITVLGVIRLGVKHQLTYLLVFFFALTRERMFIKAHSIENRCCRTGRYTVCRRIHAFFCPEILQAGAVKGIKRNT